MKSFKINDEYTIICEWKKTKIAFKHTAKLLQNGSEIDECKICYQNRTWERYDFESVLGKMLDIAKITTPEQNKELLNGWAEDNQKELDKKFGLIGAIASLGDVLGKYKNEKNDWKVRIIQAGLGEGIQMPDDWEELSEKEKESRLNNVINNLTAKA